MAMPPSKPFGQLQLVIPLCRHVPQHAHGFARDFRADAVAGENQYVEIHVQHVCSRQAGRAACGAKALRRLVGRRAAAVELALS